MSTPPKTAKKAAPKKGRKPPALPNWRIKFLEELERVGIVSHAAIVAGVDRSTVERHRRADLDFDAAMLAAREIALDSIESSFMKRAIDPKDPASATLGIFILKTQRRERFGEPKHELHIHASSAPPLHPEVAERMRAAMLESPKIKESG